MAHLVYPDTKENSDNNKSSNIISGLVILPSLSWVIIHYLDINNTHCDDSLSAFSGQMNHCMLIPQSSQTLNIRTLQHPNIMAASSSPAAETITNVNC